MITKADIKKRLIERIKIQKGDIVMLHSSYKSFGGVVGGPNEVLDAFLEVLGEEGTLLIPTFNFSSWTKDHYYDILETPSEMGIITEIARLRSEAKRTRHPIYSFSVYGAKQKEFVNVDGLLGIGRDTVFDLFHKLNGTIVSIGLEYNNSFTLVHQAETMTEVGYRRYKDFGGIYLNENREVEIKKYSFFVRATSHVGTMVNPALEILFGKGVIKNTIIGRADVKYTKAVPFVEHLVPLTKSNPEFFHTIKDKK
jgi:aminoglycoside 3-N-acetyltransferase